MTFLEGFSCLERQYFWWFFASVATLVLFIIWSGSRKYRQTHPSMTDEKAEELGDKIRKRPLFSPLRLFMIGVFLAATILFVPIVVNDSALIGEGELDFAKGFKTALISIHNAIKLFVVDSDFSMITGATESFTSFEFRNAISIYASLFFVGAPLITAGFLLSFVKEFGAIVKIGFHLPGKKVFVFSELNEMSLALARDIAKQVSLFRRILIFTDVYENDEEHDSELISKAKTLGAKCLKRDIAEINPRYFGRDETRRFYCIGQNQDENVKQALKVIAQCTSIKKCNKPSTEVYVFATSAESEILLDTIDNKEIRVRRVNENKNIVYKAMRENSIFADAEKAQKERLEKLQKECQGFNDEKAKEIAKEYIKKRNGVKEISIAIIGLGGYGTELLKTLTWICQVEGYYLYAHIFDYENGHEKMKLIAPELAKSFEDRKKGNSVKVIDGHEYIKDDANYKLYFYDKTDVKTEKFFKKIVEVESKHPLTGVYVTLGSDNLNLQTAMKIRSKLYDKSSVTPAIYAVVFNSLKTDMIRHVDGLKTHNGEPYNVTLIGDLESTFTLETIEQKRMEEAALKCHMYWSERWIDKELARSQFKKFEYYRRASMAQALYYNVLALNNLRPCYNDEDLVKWEHARWNAYMRAEGYVYGSKKNNVMKTHKELVPFSQLDKKQWEKDLIFADGVLSFETGIDE